MISVFAFRRFRFVAAAALGACFGCSPAYYKEDADCEVYTILREKEREVFGKEHPFSLEDFGGRPEVKREVLKLNLRKSLLLAARHSRSFQNQRESLYLAALNLTGDRNTYAPQFLATLSGALSGDKKSSTGSLTGVAGLNKAWKWGLSSAVRFSTSLLKTFTSVPNPQAGSSLTVSLAQPLLRGFGAKIAAENLTQSERNVIYAVRSFERFRKEFAVTITGLYLRALQKYDAVENARANYDSTRRNYEQIKAKAEVGFIPLFQLDQAETDLLSAEDRLNRAKRDLKEGLDNFKLSLGLPLEQEIELDTTELTKIKAVGIESLGIDASEAMEIAMACRLDLANQRDAVEDAERKVEIAADDLRAQLDLVGDLTIPTEKNKPGKLSTDKLTYRVGFELDLPLERTRERNTYRAALISLEREKRDLEDFEDRTKLEVASAFRDFERAFRSYRIQLKSRKVARGRVESTQELLKYGRVETRDLLEALNADLSARNAVTAALIDYEIAYLHFLLGIGVLEIDQDGVYVELTLGDENAEPKKIQG